jgi:hypothetical protein
MAAHRKSDRRHDDLYGGGLRNVYGHFFVMLQRDGVHGVTLKP